MGMMSGMMGRMRVTGDAECGCCLMRCSEGGGGEGGGDFRYLYSGSYGPRNIWGESKFPREYRMYDIYIIL